MKNVVCWYEESVISATPRDAVTLSPAAFQAIHHPLKLKRRRMEQDSGGRSTDEAQLLKVLQGALRPDGFLFVPVVGGSGTGKSHLVRWARENLHGTENWEIRYLPKNGTSIRRVIEEVIAGMDGPVAEKARKDLAAAAPSNENSDVLADRLLDELAILVGRLETRDGDGRSREQAFFVENRQQQLADILRDPVVRRRLRRGDAVIPRLVDLAMAGRTPGDGLDDDAVYIAPEDLPGAESELAVAGDEVRKFLNELQSIPEFLKMSVELLNEVLPTAVRRVFISNQIDLVDVLREVRRDLLAAGRELVLFIEDLTVLHGVEREFLDAIVEPAVTAGVPTMAPLRVLFAVTDGHFKALDTVRTRCDEAFWLDSAYEAEDGVGREEAASFVGRYFNAGRLSAEDLSRAWETGGSGWLPNACTTCEHQQVCHESFGVTEEGYGLYPLNSEALDRFVGVLSPARFDPRRVVGAVANQFLLEGRRELDRSEFPSTDLLEPFRDDSGSDDLNPLLLSELRTRSREQADQVVGVVRYWGGGRDAPESVLSAFGLRSVELPEASEARSSTSEKSRSPRRSTLEPAARATNPLTGGNKKVFDLLQSWANDGSELTMTAVNTLRKLVHENVKGGLEYGPVPLNLNAAFYEERFKADKHIAFEGSVSFKKSEILRVERSAENASALQGLLLLQEAKSFSAMESGDSYRLVVASQIEEWTSVVRSHLAVVDDNELFGRLKGLVLVARLLGVDGGTDEPAQILSGVLRLLGGELPAEESRSDHWKKLTESANKFARDFAPSVETYFGEARGSGSVKAVRAHLLLPIIEQVTASWDFAGDEAELERVLRHLPKAIESEWSSLTRALKTIDPEVDPNSPLAAQLQTCVEALETAARLGRSQSAELLGDLKERVKRIDEHHDRALKKARDARSSSDVDRERTKILASAVPSRVREAESVVVSATSQLLVVEQDLENRRRDLGDPVDAVSVVAEILESATTLREAAAVVLS